MSTELEQLAADIIEIVYTRYSELEDEPQAERETVKREVVAKLAGEPSTRKKASYVGPPAVFSLEQCCQQINDAFGDYGCYLVGSAIERPDWRDVDIRFIMADDDFAKLFPNANTVNAHWEHDPRWLLLIVSITEWMRRVTGLPVDFQIQPQTFANKHHNKIRHAIGLRVAKPEEDTQHE